VAPETSYGWFDHYMFFGDFEAASEVVRGNEKKRGTVAASCEHSGLLIKPEMFRSAARPKLAPT